MRISEENRVNLQPRLLFRHGSDQGFENLEAIGTAKLGLTRSLGVRHHSKHVSAWAADACDVVQRAVGIRIQCDFALRARIAEYDLIIAL